MMALTLCRMVFCKVKRAEQTLPKVTKVILITRLGYFLQAVTS